MNVYDLLRRLCIEVDKLLTTGGTCCLLVVRGETCEKGVDSWSNTIRLIQSLSLVGSMVLVVQVGDGREESVGDAMLLIEGNSALDSGIAENIAMGKILSNDSASGLLLLGDLVAITLSVMCEVTSIIIGGSSGASDLDLRSTELGIVKKKGSLGCGFLLKGYGRALAGFDGRDLEAGDLATEGKEIANFLLAGGRTDVLNVNCVGRHGVGVVSIWFLLI